MSPEAQHAFLFGDPEPVLVHYESKNGRTRDYTCKFLGFFGWIGDWDVGGCTPTGYVGRDVRRLRIGQEHTADRTLGLALAPKKQTTSVAYENIEPGAHTAIENAPGRVIVVRQGGREMILT